MEEDEKISTENIINDIHVLQQKIKQYIDIRAPFKSNEETKVEFDIARYQKMSIRSLDLIHQSLQEQLLYFEEADANPIDIQKPFCRNTALAIHLHTMLIEKVQYHSFLCFIQDSICL